MTRHQSRTTAMSQKVVSAPRHPLLHWLILALCLIATLATVVFGLRSYHSFLLLRSAYAAGTPFAA